MVNVRTFSIVNSDGNTLELMEKHHFAYSPTGLGVDMDNKYFASYGSYLLDTSGIKQGNVKFNIVYGYETGAAYKDFHDVVTFLNKGPLQLLYSFPGMENDTPYARDVAVSTLDKGEKSNDYDILTSELTLEVLSPWYQYVSYSVTGSGLPIRPAKGYYDSKWEVVSINGELPGSYETPAGKKRSYTVSNGRMSYLTTTADMYTITDEPMAVFASDVAGKSVYLQADINSEPGNQTDGNFSVGFMLKEVGGSNYNGTPTIAKPGAGITISFNKKVTIPSTVTGVIQIYPLAISNNDDPLRSGSLYNFSNIRATIESSAAVGEYGEGVYLPSGRPNYVQTPINAPSYAYNYTYQTDPSRITPYVQISNSSVYLGLQKDSPLYVTITADNSTGVIHHPGWLLYDKDNKIVQQERILIDIPVGSTLAVNSDYKDREISLYSNDEAHTVKDEVSAIDPTVKGFVRVPIGNYRLEMDADTLAQLGGFYTGHSSVQLKQEWLVV